MTRWAILYSLAGLLLAATRLEAQSLDYVDHLNIEFPHYTVLSTNISLFDDPYRDAEGNLVPVPSGTAGVFNLFSSKYTNVIAYDSEGFGGWAPQSNSVVGLGLTPGSEVSYYAHTYTFTGPNVSNNFTLQQGFLMASRAGLVMYNLVNGDRAPITLKMDESAQPYTPYTPGNALLAAGDRIFLTSNGGIYSLDPNAFNTGNGQLTPFATTPGSGPGELSNPSAMSVGPDGLLYVLDAGNNRIQKFNLETGAYSGEFNLPGGLSVYSDIMEMQTSPDNPTTRIPVLDAEGHYIYTNTSGNVFSTSLAISHEGHIYLGDGAGGGFVFDLNGDLLSTFHPPAEDANWADGGLNLDFLGNLSIGAGSYLQYDGYGNIITYVEGKGLFLYRDPTYPTLEADLTLSGSRDTTITRGDRTYGNMTFDVNGIVNIIDSITLDTGVMRTSVSGYGFVVGGSINAPDGMDLVANGPNTIFLRNHSTSTSRLVVNAGAVVLDGSIAGDVVVGTAGYLGGSGEAGGNVTLEGSAILGPGSNAPGTLDYGSIFGRLTVDRDLTLSDFSTLFMEIGGTTDGLFDQLTVEGLFTADGILNLVLLNGYVPVMGDSFQLFTEGGFDAGAFKNITTNLGDGLYWDTSNLASLGVVQVVPEPSTWALLGLGVGLLLWRRKCGR